MADFALARIPIHESTCIQHDIDIEPINVTLYWWMVGKLRYVTKNQPDFQYVINIVTRHMHSSQIEHFHVV
jgi:hypothetical protein